MYLYPCYAFKFERTGWAIRLCSTPLYLAGVSMYSYAPGSDFNKYDSLGTVLAGFHYDLNLLTIHGKSRFPGLSVWLRDGRWVTSVPLRRSVYFVSTYMYSNLVNSHASVVVVVVTTIGALATAAAAAAPLKRYVAHIGTTKCASRNYSTAPTIIMACFLPKPKYIYGVCSLTQGCCGGVTVIIPAPPSTTKA